VMDCGMVVGMWDVPLPTGTELSRRCSDTISDSGEMEPANDTNFRCHSRPAACTDPPPPRRCFFPLLESMIGGGSPRTSGDKPQRGDMSNLPSRVPALILFVSSTQTTSSWH